MTTAKDHMIRNVRGRSNTSLSSILELGCGCGLVGIWLYTSYVMARSQGWGMDGVTKIYMTDKANQLHLTRFNMSINNITTQYRDARDNGSAVRSNVGSTGGSSCATDGDNICQRDMNGDDSRLDGVSATTSDIQLICSEFDWFDQQHLLRYDQVLRDDLRVIIACDVLYDKELAMQILHVISILAVPHETLVILAQKLRGNDKDTSSDGDNNSNSGGASYPISSHDDGSHDHGFNIGDVADVFRLIDFKKMHSAYHVIIWTFMVDYP